MAVRNETIAAGGNFGDDNIWSGKHHPVAGDTANISSTFSGVDYSVAVTDAEAAAQINIGAANAELAVEGGAILTVGSIDLSVGTLTMVSGGEITGGTTITEAAGANTRFQDGTLDGATWQGTLALDGIAQASSLTITSSLDVLNTAGNGPGEIDITGPGAELDFGGIVTLNGTGGNLVINIGTSSPQGQYLGVGANALLTLGTAVSLNQIAAGSTVHLIDVGGATGGTITNDGTMSFTSGTGSGAFVTVSNFINNGMIILAGGGSSGAQGEDLELTPQNVFAEGATGGISVSGYGLVHINGPNGSVDLSGTNSVSSFGTLDLDTASVAVSDTLGAGVVQISTFGTLEVNYDYKGTVVFLDPTGTLALGNQGGAYTGAIEGLSRINSSTLDVIDLLLTNVTSLKPDFTSPVGGTLNVMDGSTTLAALSLIGDYVGAQFNFASDQNGGTNVFVGCFAAGAGILTDRGEVAVERLREGDLVVTRLGPEPKSAPVRWIGVSRIDLDRHPRARAVAPVRIVAGAFGEGLPCRDLLLSPDHAVYVDGVLIPIQYLENGTTIRREPARGVVTYYHVELDEHSVLVADGLPAESYLDTGGRANFADGGGVRALYPEFVARRWESAGCAPLVVTGPVLSAARRRVNAQVESVLARPAHGDLVQPSHALLALRAGASAG